MSNSSVRMRLKGALEPIRIDVEKRSTSIVDDSLITTQLKDPETACITLEAGAG